ncbi:MAG: asparagine synthase (glutamine-hydrolyzing) [Anaerolineae bacterium]
MCGITGILSFDKGASVSCDLIQKMTDCLQHRGPDDDGLYATGPIGLGHRRLAIIDLSPGGHQPMPGPDGTTWLIYNGEIYNYRDIRAELEAQGHRFKSHSDTEVILHAYQEYGPDCLARFNGMFAFALWDEQKQQLFLARDRFGIKPLYFYRDNRRLIFASEIKAILAVLDSTPQPNQRLIYDFLTVGALDHTDDTFFEGIYKLPPAHSLVVDTNGREQLRKYWDFEVSNEVAQLSDQEAAKQSEAFFELFTEAVRAHLISDVPVGSCLSGGLDSSAVVSVISRLIQEQAAASVGPRQHTFSACYQNKTFDEQPYIEHVIQWTGAVSNRTFPDAAGFRRQLPQLIWHQEEPFVSTSMYAQWEVMRLAREKGVTVLLDGQGADEQLLGYRKFYVFYIQTLLRSGHPWLGLTEMTKHFGSWGVLKTLQLRRGLRYLKGGQFGSVTIAHKLLRDSFTRPFQADPLRIGVESTLGERIKADLTRFSLPSLLRYEDKNSMAFSREARVPFLDFRLIEFVAGLPLNLKLRDGWTKYVLRRGGQNKMPEQILTRRDKLGFATPEDDWFRQALSTDFHDTFAQPVFLPKFVQMTALQQEFEAYVKGQRPLLSSDFFFRFFILEHWARAFILP